MTSKTSLFNQDRLQEEKMQKRDDKQYLFFTALDPKSNGPEEEQQDLSKPRNVHCKSKWNIIHDGKPVVEEEK